MVECLEVEKVRSTPATQERREELPRTDRVSQSLGAVWRWLNPADVVDALCSTADLLISGLVSNDLDELYPNSPRTPSRG
jgi:hypothetical protein